VVDALPEAQFSTLVHTSVETQCVTEFHTVQALSNTQSCTLSLSFKASKSQNADIDQYGDGISLEVSMAYDKSQEFYTTVLPERFQMIDLTRPVGR
jgi:hypothetical protein